MRWSGTIWRSINPATSLDVPAVTQARTLITLAHRITSGLLPSKCRHVVAPSNFISLCVGVEIVQGSRDAERCKPCICRPSTVYPGRRATSVDSRHRSPCPVRSANGRSHWLATSCRQEPIPRSLHLHAPRPRRGFSSPEAVPIRSANVTHSVANRDGATARFTAVEV
jgi:hypothetical protein